MTALLRLPGTNAVVTFDTSKIPVRVRTMAIRLLRSGVITGGGMSAHLASVLNTQFELGCQRSWRNWRNCYDVGEFSPRAVVAEYMKADIAAILLAGKKSRGYYSNSYLQGQTTEALKRIEAGENLTVQFWDTTVFRKFQNELAGRRDKSLLDKTEQVLARIRAGVVLTLDVSRVPRW